MSKDSFVARYLNVGGVLLLTLVIPVVFLVSSADLAAGAGIFPISMSVLMLLCGVMSFYKKFRKGDLTGAPLPVAVSAPRLLLVVCALFLFIPLAQFLGFYTTNFVYIIAGFLFLVGRCSKKDILQAFVVAGIFVFVEKLIFYDLLVIMTPAGIFY